MAPTLASVSIFVHFQYRPSDEYAVAVTSTSLVYGMTVPSHSEMVLAFSSMMGSW